MKEILKLDLERCGGNLYLVRFYATLSIPEPLRKTHF